MSTGSGLDALFARLTGVSVGGNAVTGQNRSGLNFASLPAGSTVTDNPTLGTVDLAIPSTPTYISGSGLYLSVVDLVTGYGLGGVGTTSASETMAVGFGATQAGHYCGGVRGYWAGSATTLKASLWNAAGSRVTSATLAVTGAGTYSIPFASAQAITAGAPYAVSVWDTSGSQYTYFNGSNTGTDPLGPFLPTDIVCFAGPFLLYCGVPALVSVSGPAQVFGLMASGDAAPSTSSASKWSPLEPMVS